MKNRDSQQIRIATLYRQDYYERFVPYHMTLTRWLRISEALAQLGYHVDVIANVKEETCILGPRLRIVPFSRVDWKSYDVVKTLFHLGFDSLEQTGGSDHPLIISKLGSVVGSHDAVSGVHFFGKEHSDLFDTQCQINNKSKYVTVLTESSRSLWHDEFGYRTPTLYVPTGVDQEIPPPVSNPYQDYSEKIAVYIGMLYTNTQRDINILWQEKLNSLGKMLNRRGIRLCFVGLGRIDKLDPRAVTYLGPVENSRIWDYQYFADAAITLAQGEAQHNESSKIYYYLRTGTPVVSEDSIPNNHLLEESGLGLVSKYNDTQMMADMVEEAVHRQWPTNGAISYMLANHTWEIRAQIYDQVIRKELGLNNVDRQAKCA